MSVYSLAVVHCALIRITLIRLPAMGSLKCAAFRVCPEPAGDGAALAAAGVFPVVSGVFRQAPRWPEAGGFCHLRPALLCYIGNGMIHDLLVSGVTVFPGREHFEFVPGINVVVGGNDSGKSHLLKLCYTVAKWSADGGRKSLPEKWAEEQRLRKRPDAGVCVPRAGRADGPEPGKRPCARGGLHGGGTACRRAWGTWCLISRRGMKRRG